MTCELQCKLLNSVCKMRWWNPRGPNCQTSIQREGSFFVVGLAQISEAFPLCGRGLVPEQRSLSSCPRIFDIVYAQVELVCSWFLFPGLEAAMMFRKLVRSWDFDFFKAMFKQFFFKRHWCNNLHECSLVYVEGQDIFLPQIYILRFCFFAVEKNSWKWA